MDSYDLFKEDIKKAVEEFKKIDKKEVIRVISHLDADGISACAIMIKLLNNDNRKYSVSILQQLNRAVLSQLALEPYNCIIFTDIGSGFIDEILITKNLYLKSEPDLVIRPGGEKRMSNFLLWQSCYSELFFTDKLWPEFTKKDLIKCIEEFNKRDRRFGS